ncbi:biotin--[acetyl-CoA-carboxylase] ligase [Paludicola sp. MB14-C6]|uniref:biotin--[acetyl-CoA-carboxylase] ligase n=1 Tax=Paludihabitans sp. MB14-C6 TaxID=3070656 RepID=UPI0027DE848C|nr:biotin--[acetyl-CoA-carboxylase] ligase [Paludicola sp. MB14-C6]WMJ22438.1 biotin--[acetyl-CoA-carboxylase] ligase [Paludicola sp. MB14-C6]
MTTKEMIVTILEENKDHYFSGETLAAQLNVSRAAISKAVKELKKEGFTIDAVTNKGYCLSSESDVLSSAVIESYLQKNGYYVETVTYKTIESTNQTAKKMALDGANHGTVVLSEEQTQGRGRLGRSFYSPKNSGIYMSIILRPQFDMQSSLLITTAASVAVCRAIEKLTRIQAEIKWVNDIYLNGKKVCGILTEAVTDFESGTIEHIILGIGINVTTANFPDEIKEIASALLNSSSNKLTRNELAAEIIYQVFEITNELQTKEFMSEYKKRSFVIGQKVNVIQPTNTFLATAIDINEQGGLVVKAEDGQVIELNTGEVSIRKV